MNRNDKKAFFDNFTVKNLNPMSIYLSLDLEGKKKLFSRFLSRKKGLREISIKQYIGDHLKKKDVLDVIKKDSHKENLYEVTDILALDKIYEDCNKLQVNKKRNNVYTASVSNYKDFINFLKTEEAIELLKEEESDEPSRPTSQEAGITSKPSVNFSISREISLINETGLLYTPKLIKRFAFSLMSKRFLILSGLAGSGKTQLAIAFANSLIEDGSQLCVVSVGADWTNREPLLGFPNALQQNEYVKPECGALDLLIEANKEENKMKPYFLILDEMNMSYVERYFADFLSAMESHEPIKLWHSQDAASMDVPEIVSLPKNLFIIGTINVDETTYMFSPKVLDRANVIEFKISENEMDQFLNEMKPVDRNVINFRAADMGESFVQLASSNELAEGDTYKATLKSFFSQLKSVNAEFGYRSATEIYRFICQAEKNDDTEEKLNKEDILDCAIVQKLLPKLHGSRKKLESVLQALWKECFIDKRVAETMPISKANVEKATYQLTADKIQRMYEAAYANGFTSFAEA